MSQHQHSERPPSFEPEAQLLASCLRCGRLHRPADTLFFDPVCPTCAPGFPLGLLGMNGWHPLSHAAIDAALLRTSPGNFALGFMEGGVFSVFYVGRSDSDVRARLHRWVGAPSRYARYASPARAAWSAGRAKHGRPLGTASLGRVGAREDSSYTHFAFSYAPSAEDAFLKELRNFHDFGGLHALDNEAEPRPHAR